MRLGYTSFIYIHRNMIVQNCFNSDFNIELLGNDWSSFCLFRMITFSYVGNDSICHLKKYFQIDEQVLDCIAAFGVIAQRFGNLLTINPLRNETFFGQWLKSIIALLVILCGVMSWLRLIFLLILLKRCPLCGTWNIFAGNRHCLLIPRYALSTFCQPL